MIAALPADQAFAALRAALALQWIGGRSAGDSIVLPARAHALQATVRLRSYVPIDSLEIVRNGEVVARLRPQAGGTRADTTVSLAVSESGWYLARAYAAGARHPVLDLQPLGTTSPVGRSLFVFNHAAVATNKQHPTGLDHITTTLLDSS